MFLYRFFLNKYDPCIVELRYDLQPPLVRIGETVSFDADPTDRIYRVVDVSTHFIDNCTNSGCRFMIDVIMEPCAWFPPDDDEAQA